MHDAGVPWLLWGPSPRGRGNLEVVAAATRKEGSIPARGGTSHGFGHWEYDKGPSPRGRGNPIDADDPHLRARSIPARAGEPRRRAPGGGPRAVHPRAGGGTKGFSKKEIAAEGPSPRGRGNREGADRSLDRAGPSPRGRGNLVADRESQAARGSIPARAGEPRSRPIPHRLRRVHPRAGGGTSVIQIQTAAAKGPSPRGRGNRGSPAQAERLAGSIPARAGEPSARSHPRTRPGVHPRAGGGTRCGRSLKVSPSGPSPRGRGNPRGRRGSPGRSGSIPARAGEPPGDCTAREPGRVHPRAGGGTARGLHRQRARQGPSPRGRGNLFSDADAALQEGSIPARAGEPDWSPP